MDAAALAAENARLRRELAERDRLLEARESEAAAERHKRALLEASNERLAHELALLKRQLFGRKNERVEYDPAQLQLIARTVPPVPPAPEPPEEPAKERLKGHGRGKLPEHLDRRRIERKVPSDAKCANCGGELRLIGEATSERLEWVPGHFEVLQIARQKCACPRCPAQGIVTADEPTFALPRALPGDGLLARVLVDKFADHIPLNRQTKRFAREGVDISVSTLCGWVRGGAGLLRVVVDAMRDEILVGDWLQADATGMPVQDGTDGALRRGHLFAYSNGEHVVFRFSATKESTFPKEHLAGFQGRVILVDGGSEFNLVAKSEGVERAGCWSHVRRKFFEARDSDPLHADLALTMIRQLFAVERLVRTSPPDERLAARDRWTRPILDGFRRWLVDRQADARPSSPLGRAVGYAVNQWEHLVVFLDHGGVPAHNNASERHLRQPVVGRKNWMFAGSEGGAESAAVLFSIVGSCILQAVDPWEYLRDVLGRLPDHPANRVGELTPAAWRASRMASQLA